MLNFHNMSNMNNLKRIFLRSKRLGKSFLQRVVITLQLSGANGLANHASACAYGFLLSIAPMLLLITFFIFIFFNPSPRAVVFIFQYIPILGSLFDSQWLESDFFSAGVLGFSGIVSILSIFWAGRILALSMQRALAGVFPVKKNRNPVSNMLVALAITAAVFLLVVIYILCSPVALRIYRYYLDLTNNRFLHIFVVLIGSWFSPIILLAVISLLTYLFIPVNPPKRFSAFQGSLFFTLSYTIMYLILGFILDTSNYNFIYGTFGSLIFLLVNVYFFFFLFFIGAQYAYVIDFFDALLFCKMRLSRINAVFRKSKFPDLYYLLFSPYRSSLDKFIQEFKKDEVIISKGDSGNDIYYILEGEVEILLSLEDNTSVAVLNTDSFFGEMGYLLSEARTAYIKAKTDVCVLVLPPVLYEAILKNDTSLDRDIIENITRRLKNTTEQLAASSK